MKDSEMLLHANLLESLNKKFNLLPVKTIIHYFRVGDFEAARKIYFRDFDIIAIYPEVSRELAAIFNDREEELRAKKILRRR